MLRTVLVIIFAGISTGLGSVAAAIGGLFDPYSKFVNWVIRTWAKGIIKASGIKVEIEGLDRFDHDKAYIVIANHQGNFDILVLSQYLPLTARFVAKKELFRIPLFAQGMRLAGMIEIDRGNSAKARATLQRTVDVIRSGVSVIIFPEGTRSKDGTIQRFKKGGFILALDTGVPLLPVSISGSRYIMQKNSIWLRKGRIKIVFDKPIDPKNYTYQNRNKLLETVRQVIIKNFDPNYK
ncbi:MAG TPA: 1-acyl-sn-glycerol-3-phosphate acyltransferase [Calditrichaeota bacterium]|nr:1-acyl-sn-glycerol-3-phosphate acyltransferase [Calditrichota bacterium]